MSKVKHVFKFESTTSLDASSYNFNLALRISEAFGVSLSWSGFGLNPPNLLTQIVIDEGGEFLVKPVGYFRMFARWQQRSIIQFGSEAEPILMKNLSTLLINLPPNSCWNIKDIESGPRCPLRQFDLSRHRLLKLFHTCKD